MALNYKHLQKRGTDRKVCKKFSVQFDKFFKFFVQILYFSMQKLSEVKLFFTTFDFAYLKVFNWSKMLRL